MKSNNCWCLDRSIIILRFIASQAFFRIQSHQAKRGNSKPIAEYLVNTLNLPRTNHLKNPEDEGKIELTMK